MTAGTAGTVGIVGAGQLARMLCEAASALDVTTVVLAERPGDAANEVASDVMIGAASDRDAVERLARRCAVVTFDHEQVDPAMLGELERQGHVLRPGPATLALTVDKLEMRRRLGDAGVPCPAYASVPGSPTEGGSVLEEFAAGHRWPLVLKAAAGGYDGRGVWVVNDRAEALEVVRGAEQHGRRLLVEEMVPIDQELAVMVARRPGGDTVSWPAVETAQVAGVCREVLVPGHVPDEVAEAAGRLGLRVSELAGSVGVLAVELFSTPEGLMVNELAARPHNSGHWSIEGSETSQFENHLRAVLDLPLGGTSVVAPQVAMVNVFGGERGEDPRRFLAEALATPGAHVHLYGKEPRPGRKLGHVTVRGSDADEVRRSAWRAATALGTPVPAGMAP